MSRVGVLALATVGALLVAALVLRLGDGATAPAARQAQDAQLQQLREAADLEPCPAGVSPVLPDLELPCVGAPGTVPLAAPGDGRPALVNVWATWCAPCVREVPLLQEAAVRGGDRLLVLGVLHQDTPANALRFAEDPSLGFDQTYASVVDDDGVVLRRFGSGPPITLFLRADGSIAHVERGAVDSMAELEELLDRHLDVRL